MKAPSGSKDRISITGLMAAFLLFGLFSFAILQVAPVPLDIRLPQHKAPAVVSKPIPHFVTPQPIHPVVSKPKRVVRVARAVPRPMATHREPAPRKAGVIQSVQSKTASKQPERITVVESKTTPIPKARPTTAPAEKPAIKPTAKPAPATTGPAEVKVERVTPSQATANTEWYSVRVGYSDSKYRTDMLREVLVKKGFPEAKTVKEGNLYSVKVGDFQFRHQAEKANDELKQIGQYPKIVEKTVAK